MTTTKSRRTRAMQNNNTTMHCCVHKKVRVVASSMIQQYYFKQMANACQTQQQQVNLDDKMNVILFVNVNHSKMNRDTTLCTDIQIQQQHLISLSLFFMGCYSLVKSRATTRPSIQWFPCFPYIWNTM